MFRSHDPRRTGRFLAVLAVSMFVMGVVWAAGLGFSWAGEYACSPDAQGLSPEMEALFPKTECGKALWKQWTTNVFLQEDQERVHLEFSRGTYAGVCLDYHINLELYGGNYRLGLYIATPHPDHPRGEKFREVTGWERVDPKKNICVLREYYSDVGWKHNGQCIKQLITQDKLLMEIGYVDVDNDGEYEQIYRFCSADFALRKKPDNTIGYFWRYHIYQDIDIKDGFNESFMGNAPYYEPFLYEETLYWAGKYMILKGTSFLSEITGKKAFRLVSPCVFGDRE